MPPSCGQRAGGGRSLSLLLTRRPLASAGASERRPQQPGVLRGLVAAAMLLASLQPRCDAQCTMEGLLQAADGGADVRTTALPAAGRCTTATTGVSLLLKNWTISGSGAGSVWDLQFASSVYRANRESTATLTSLQLDNARLLSSPFLWLGAFSSGSPSWRLVLASVGVRTDCATLASYVDAAQLLAAGTAQFTHGPGFLYVAAYTSASVAASAVNVTCDWPLEHSSSGPLGPRVVDVADSLGLLNGLSYAQQIGGDVVLSMTSNISVDTSYWPKPFTVVRNTSIVADPDKYNVLDLHGAINAVFLADGVTLSLSNVQLMNLSPLRGTGVDIPGILPLFAIPLWFFNYTRIKTQPQLLLANSSITLSNNEFQYFVLWTLVVTSGLSTITQQAAAIREGMDLVQLGSATNNNSINFLRLRAVGADVTNYTFTSVAPSIFPVVVPDAIVPEFSLDILANFSQVPVYDVSDLMALLQRLQAQPPGNPTVLWLWKNVTLDLATWPTEGYTVSSPLLLVGRSATTHSYIDFQRVPRFIRVVGNLPDMYVYMQWLQLTNLPNALLQPGFSADGAVTDYTLPISNMRMARSRDPLGNTSLFLNMSEIVVTYREFQQLQNLVLRNGPLISNGSGTVAGASVLYTVGRSSSNLLSYERLLGFGWSGTEVDVQYSALPGTTLMYPDTADPPAPPSPPPGLGAQVNGSSGSQLEGWHIALLVVGCLLVAGLIAAFIAWRVVARYRIELESVKSETPVQAPTTAQGNGSNLSAEGVAGAPRASLGTPPAQRDSSQVRIKVVGEGDSEYNSMPTGPLDELNNMMQALTAEIDDRHLIILDVLGQGGFGTVYKGMWKGLLVAVKTITFQDRFFGGEKAQHRAILEAAISSSLAHPNVVTTYSFDIKPLKVHNGSGGMLESGTGLRISDARVTDWKLYIIQEYCDAGSLRLAVLKRKFYDPKRAEPRLEMILDTALELAGGLLHLHEKNIIHGDLNPNNVLLKRDPMRKYGAVCKLADFGLSVKMLPDQSHISNMRRGTPFYTAPEVSQKGNMTKAADVYSFGVMVWECYHSCMSYRSSVQHGFSARESFPRFQRRAPAELAELVAAAIAPEPTSRPSMSDVQAQLMAMLQKAKAGELRTMAELQGPDPEGDAAHQAGCAD